MDLFTHGPIHLLKTCHRPRNLRGQRALIGLLVGSEDYLSLCPLLEEVPSGTHGPIHSWTYSLMDLFSWTYSPWTYSLMDLFTHGPIDSSPQDLSQTTNFQRGQKSAACGSNYEVLSSLPFFFQTPSLPSLPSFGRGAIRTHGPIDSWTYGLMDLLTHGPIDSWTITPVTTAKSRPLIEPAPLCLSQAPSPPPTLPTYYLSRRGLIWPTSEVILNHGQEDRGHRGAWAVQEPRRQSPKVVDKLVAPVARDPNHQILHWPVHEGL